ncbi:diamine acetyltransferase [Alkalihalobacillus alcalophilus ATCC 27647 = CGMCC 1.3604]|uniref:Diamine acetyltransferase n=1 Tax=Alkalihalobacillus alcalophilus ATCC 27647 = CGMCC 1.3604 TaxID=1218173 RepID=A0A094YR50_ALKAL|nr:GNAT family N-acetyltransferase [Alkalihalobacillus alcalophilus]KGA95947.1 diamine acetyltransferase [Alkalihalobacillus alcalophilus ATCC 27647 = CGMCC 1.3604]MED1561765.1 GNAT family N-acetyltransferase [Alkalihalobacillus alcalophilus]THG89089.1 diamine acetyltransferase [Alkalihalobacillus alcalophilus ATCC 27647 = CGMCC 1.3604]
MNRDTINSKLRDVYFKDIDKSNEYLVKNLCLKPGQEKFIETVEECLEEAQTYSEWHPVAIYYGENVIGFAMYGSFGEQRDTWIDRIMIDQKYQGKGLGKITMLKLIDIVAERYGVKIIYLSIIEENEIAYRLYKSIGFEYINEKDQNGELIFKYTVL